MTSRSQYVIGFLTILLFASGIVYVQLGDDARVRIDDDKTTFYVPQSPTSSRWVVSGREYVSLWDGSSKMNRRARDIEVSNYTLLDNGLVEITRTVPYIRGPVIHETYRFDPNTDDITKFPLNHTIEVFNGSVCSAKAGCILQYEVRDLQYDGITRDAVSPESFGRNMKVEWEDGAYYAKVFQQVVASDKLVVKYRVDEDYEEFNVRLFDPPPSTLVNDSLYIALQNNTDIRNGINATLDNSRFAGSVAITDQNCKRGDCVTSDGLGGFLFLDAFNIPNGVDHSFNFWIKSNVSQTAGDYNVIFRWSSSGANEGGALYWGGYANNNLRYIWDDSSGDNQFFNYVSDLGLTEHMITVTYESGAYARLYVDGVEVANGTAGTHLDYNNNEDLCILDRCYAGSEGFNGTIDEFYVFNISLSPDNVSALYNSSGGRFCEGNPDCTLALQDSEPEPTLEVDPVIVAGYHLEGSAVDFSGNANDGTEGASVEYTNAGRFRRGLDLSAQSGDQITISGNQQLNLSQGGTVSLWFNYVGAGTFARLFQQGANEHSCFVSASRGLTCYSDANSENVLLAGGVEENVWHHLAYVVNETNFTVYYNGVSKGTWDAGNPGSIANWEIGSSGGSQVFNGTIDEFRIYNNTMTVSQVLALYNESPHSEKIASRASAEYQENNEALRSYYKLNANGIDNGLDGYDVENITAAPTNAGRFKQGYEFDGVNDIILLNPDIELQSFTITGWINSEDEKSINIILGHGNTGFSGFFLSLINGQLRGTLANGTAISHSYGGTINNGLWHHVAMRYNGTHTQVFTDGVAASPATTAQGTIPYTGLSQGLALGNIDGLHASRYFNGTMDEVRIYNRTLDDTEIRALYNESTYSPKISIINSTGLYSNKISIRGSGGVFI